MILGILIWKSSINLEAYLVANFNDFSQRMQTPFSSLSLIAQVELQQTPISVKLMLFITGV